MCCTVCVLFKSLLVDFFRTTIITALSPRKMSAKDKTLHCFTLCHKNLSHLNCNHSLILSSEVFVSKSQLCLFSSKLGDSQLYFTESIIELQVYTSLYSSCPGDIN